MSIPRRISDPALNDYLEVMTRAIFQAGLRWSLIESKWPAFLTLFHNFEPHFVAGLNKKQIEKISADPSILRSRKKVEATVENAKAMLDTDREHGGFRNYLRSFESYEALAADIKKRFNFMGDLNVYYFLFRTGEDVPPFDDWVKTNPGEHPRMKEMVEVNSLSGPL